NPLSRQFIRRLADGLSHSPISPYYSLYYFLLSFKSTLPAVYPPTGGWFKPLTHLSLLFSLLFSFIF
ncbi:MAG: hypothetical protein KBG40_07985, partial [Bacteroidales bacterium]|nr:hypothetical protein [Bacteroidales bacterium]